MKPRKIVRNPMVRVNTGPCAGYSIPIGPGGTLPMNFAGSVGFYNRHGDWKWLKSA